MVEVHTDRGREVLEVVFDGAAAAALRAARVGGRGRRRSRRRRAFERRERARAAVASAGRSRCSSCWQRRHGVARGALRPARRGRALGRLGRPDRLISLDSLRGVERFPHQITRLPQGDARPQRPRDPGRRGRARQDHRGRHRAQGVPAARRGAHRAGAGAGLAVRAVARRAVGEVRARLRGLARSGGPVGTAPARDLLARDRAPRAPPPPRARRQLRPASSSTRRTACATTSRSAGSSSTI